MGHPGPPPPPIGAPVPPMLGAAGASAIPPSIPPPPVAVSLGKNLIWQNSFKNVEFVGHPGHPPPPIGAPVPPMLGAAGASAIPPSIPPPPVAVSLGKWYLIT